MGTVEEDGSNEQREIKVGEPTHFIWAHGTSTTIGYHSTNKGTKSIVIPDYQNSSGCNGAGTTTTTAPSPAATEPSPATAPSPATEPSPASTHCSAGQKVAITISSDTATKQQSTNATAVADEAKLEAERIAAEATAALAAQTLADEAAAAAKQASEDAAAAAAQGNTETDSRYDPDTNQCFVKLPTGCSKATTVWTTTPTEWFYAGHNSGANQLAQAKTESKCKTQKSEDAAAAALQAKTDA